MKGLLAIVLLMALTDCSGHHCGKGTKGTPAPETTTTVIHTIASAMPTTSADEEQPLLDSITFDQFDRTLTSNGYPSPTNDQFHNFNKYAHDLGKISTAEEGAMALAQFIHESGGFQDMEEISCKQTKCPDKYRSPKCDAPGQHYYGRGYVQLTGCWNYREASLKIFNDMRLVNQPDLAASDSNIAMQTSLWFWGKNVHWRKGVREGKFGATTRAINSGECKSQNNPRVERRFQIYGNVRKAFGLPGGGDASGCRKEARKPALAAFDLSFLDLFSIP